MQTADFPDRPDRDYDAEADRDDYERSVEGVVLIDFQHDFIGGEALDVPPIRDIGLFDFDAFDVEVSLSLRGDDDDLRKALVDWARPHCIILEPGEPHKLQPIYLDKRGDGITPRSPRETLRRNRRGGKRRR